MEVPKRRFNQASKQKQKGVVAIEFAAGFMAFWLMCMAWVEMSYMSYVSAITDVTISQAAREAKKSNVDASTDNEAYLSEFRDSLTSSDSLWAGVVDANNFKISVHHLSSIAQLVTTEDPCLPQGGNTSRVCGTADNSPIAIYRISYDFSPIFTFFIDDTTFTREVIVIQEYEL